MESFVCAFLRQQATPTAMLSRQIAGWLAGTGRLSFDDEPELYYMATILDAPALHRQHSYGEFTVTYTANPPFAMSDPKNIPLGQQGVRYPATVPAPAKLRIQNPNPTAVSNIHIVIRRMEQ